MISVVSAAVSWGVRLFRSPASPALIVAIAASAGLLLASLYVEREREEARFAERAEQRVEAAKRRVEAAQARRKAEYEAANSSDVDLCVALGGVREACVADLRARALRGAQPPAASK